MRIRPLTGQTFIEILPADKVSAGGIEFPERALTPDERQADSHNPTKPQPLQGRIVAIGPWPKLKCGLAVMPQYAVGDRVLVQFNAGIQMQRNIGERFRMVENEEVLAILT